MFFLSLLLHFSVLIVILPNEVDPLHHCAAVCVYVCVYTEYSWKPKIYTFTCSHFFSPLQLPSFTKNYSKNLFAKITRRHLCLKKKCPSALAVSSAALYSHEFLLDYSIQGFHVTVWIHSFLSADSFHLFL